MDKVIQFYRSLLWPICYQTVVNLAVKGGQFGSWPKWPVPERVQYKLCATVHQCLQHKAPQYMIDCCVYTSDIAPRQHLRSAGWRQLLVPRHRRSMFGRRAFSVAGPAAWNSLPDYLRDPTRSVDSFRRDLKTLLFSFYWRKQRIRGFAIMHSTNLLLTLTMTLTVLQWIYHTFPHRTTE